MGECVQTTDARRGSPAGATSPTRPGSNSKTETMNTDNSTSQNLPDRRTSARSADNSGTQQLPMERDTHQALSAVSSGQTESIEIPAHKRIKWDQHQGFTGILDTDRMRWRRAFPRVKLNVELRIMHEWLLSNPAKRKKNYFRFVSAWLSRCQDVGGSSGVGLKPATCSGNYQWVPRTKEQIEAATRENQRPGGNCDRVAALQKELRGKL